MAVCLERSADLHIVQLMPLPLTVSCFNKISLVLPFWYRRRAISVALPNNSQYEICARSGSYNTNPNHIFTN